jgi:hypothetical protein
MKIPRFTAEQSLGPAAGSFAARRRIAMGRGAIVPQLPVGNTGGGGTDCVSEYQDCYVGCGVDYPEGSSRDVCEAACDNVYERCKLRGSIFGVGGFRF